MKRYRGLKNGGTIFSQNNTHINFEKNSLTLFDSNIAAFGAVIFSLHSSMIRFKDQSTVIFNNNTAYECGVLISSRDGYNGYNMSIFNMQTLKRNSVVFSGNSSIAFINNTVAIDGTLVFSGSYATVKDHSVIIFKRNTVQHSSGGAIACYNNSDVAIEGYSKLTFDANMAGKSGGGIHSYNKCNIIFTDNSASIFINNMVRKKDGAIFASKPSRVIFEGNSTATLDNNTADIGGALYLNSSFSKNLQKFYFIITKLKK